ncbi:RNA methyltransferase [Candidatus Rariloculus sp.]|uniref:RNA methyltransferase n=1 Tax=Candidatus Rariloculus sp. TaxID=3101265 RepID=UPI003D152C20
MHIPVRIVLVAPTHPGNIGATARAMKTMGLTDLALVAPQRFPSDEARARASGADDVLENATVTQTLPEAIRDRGYVVGASARLRSSKWPVVNPRTCAESIRRRLPDDRVAIVMGPEHSGLSNEDLGRCQELVHIPTDPAFGSLNLAMAVQVLCYELRMCLEGSSVATEEARGAPLASAAELEGFHEHLERVLAAAGFLHPVHQKQLKLKLRRLFHRARPDQNEINILRGIVAALDPARYSDERGPA